MTKRIKYIFFAIFVFLGFQVNVQAGSLSIWASASNVVVGQSVTISVKASNLAGKFDVTSSNQGILAGGANESWLENDTYTFKFTAKSVGQATITATAVDVADFDSNGSFSGSKSVTLNVIAKQSSSSGSSSSSGTTADKKEYSSDNNLSSLGVEGYSLTPEFNADTVEYKLAVDQVVEKINVVAKANHEKASVTGTGEIALSSGENTIEVKVVAENGNEKVYKLIVTVEDQNPISVKVGKEEFTIVKKNNQLISLLDTYEETTIKIDDQDVVAYVNEKTKVTLVLLKDKDNKIGYYVYDKLKNTYEEYYSFSVGGVTIQLLSAPFTLENYKKYSLKKDEFTIDFYKLKKSYKVGLIYGTNVATGNTGYYVYDQNEETLSKYYDDEVELYKEKLEQQKDYLMIFMGIVAGIGIILIVASIVTDRRRKKRKKFY